MEATLSAFSNRLAKNLRHFGRWAKRQGLTAYRLYDLDLPEVPWAIDWYAGKIHVAEYPRSREAKSGQAEEKRRLLLEVVRQALGVSPSDIFVKVHSPKKWGQEQYEKQNGRKAERLQVEENGLKFWVNLSDYLDTGLFLDHRTTRARVREAARDKRFLNLFCYTGSFTVYAAAGGARSTTSVDLSQTYLKWAEDNLRLNGLWPGPHELVNADVAEWLDEASQRGETFDLAVVDPPPFSVSKKMQRTFDVQRDHLALLEAVMKLLSPKGALYFSTNYQQFQLGALPHSWTTEELTPKSLPPDFHRKDIHRCWRIHC